MLQADPSKIKAYQVDLAPGSSINLSNQNGYPYLSAQAPGRSVTVANVRLTSTHCSPDACVMHRDICRPAQPASSSTAFVSSYVPRRRAEGFSSVTSVSLCAPCTILGRAVQRGPSPGCVSM